MPINLTGDQVLGMAPDAGSAKSGKELANVRKWVTLGATDTCAWGECQGSGSLPYQTRIDLTEIAFKCSCPSRKFPCKHGLGLLLLLVDQAAAFTQKDPPAWVTDWLGGRQERAEKKAKKAEEPEKPVDAAAQAKRTEQRKQKIAAGIAELDRWMQDVVRQGLASLPDKPYSFWETMAARLVDAQAPGLARMIRDCSGISSSGAGWQERLLERLGKIYLVIEAYNRFDSLAPELQEEIKTLIGFTVSQDELLKADGVKDTWEVVAQHVEQEDKLRVQRSWLHGVNTKRWALVLTFAHGTAPLDTSLIPGCKVDAELIYFPASLPLRALIKNKTESSAAVQINAIPAQELSVALATYAQALSKNPWVERFPLALKDVIPMQVEGEWQIVDREKRIMPLTVRGIAGWQVLACSAGRPVNLFGEFDGRSLTPFVVAAADKLVRLG